MEEFVVQSEIRVPVDGAAALEDAFRSRLGAVETAPGFRRLEVWADRADPGHYVMVSWWTSRAEFVAYMRSDDHARSHARIPGGEHRPHPIGVRRFGVVAR
ncbi:MAG: antibiotic biosynthesis monooxygenase family protein [Acidimicrobiales bacterium]